MMVGVARCRSWPGRRETRWHHCFRNGVVSLKVETADPGHVVDALGWASVRGVGFAMSSFIANLAFEDASLVESAKLGILAASFLSGLLGSAFCLQVDGDLEKL